MDDHYCVVDDDQGLRWWQESGQHETLMREKAEMEKDPAYQYWLDARQDELSEQWNNEQVKLDNKP